MKNLVKKSIAAFLLLTVLTINALAECSPASVPCGNMQCPAPCSLNGSTTPDTENDKDQDSDDLRSIIIKMFEKIGFLF